MGFTYYIQTGAWTWEVSVAALACGLVIDTMLMVNNFRDRDEGRALRQAHGRRLPRGRSRPLGLFRPRGRRRRALSHALAGGRPWATLLPLAYLAAHTATWRKMVRIDHGEELNVCLGETARNILLFEPCSPPESCWADG